ncbi:MAG TPA: ABC transporter substrate-binding protein [Caproiciproducens sp.]|nr:ABC transporter substrate-binding protein [Caproiciproducens sp.]
MNLSRKITSVTLAALLFLSVASGCGSSNVGSSASPASATVVSVGNTQKATIKLATLKGPTGLGMLKLMSDSDATSSNRYEFTLAGAPDEIVSKISTGEIDAAAVPTNLAATLYNKTNGKIQMAAVNTLGVLSVLTNGENIASIKDLKGKTVYSSGQGSTPEYALNYILEQNGLEVGKDVKVEYKAEHAELAALVISGKAKIAVLPEPFVTQVTAKNKDVKIALDITKEWNKAAGDKSVLTMGCLIVRKDFAEKNREAFNKFLEEYKASSEFTNSNIEQAAALSEKYGIMPAAVAKKAIPNCNIVYMDGSEMKAKIPDFLNVLYKANPKSVGGKLPGDDFYYEK